MTEASSAEEFIVTCTSRYTATLNDVVLKMGPNTRLILRSELVVNAKDADASVGACLMHQRRHSRDQWRDAESFQLPHLKAGEEVRLNLSAGETKKLYDALTMQYQLPVGEWSTYEPQRYTVFDSDSGRVVTGRVRDLLDQLLEEEGEEVWDHIDALRPGLLEAARLKRQHHDRTEALEAFQYHLTNGDWGEDNWQQFFEVNQWIFGYSLAHQILTQVRAQPHYGGTSVTGRGGQRGDFLMSTEANIKFTVVVEIKKPETELLGKPYRGSVYVPGPEVIGGMAQLQSNCRTWAHHGSTLPENRDTLEKENVFTCEPKGILVVGNTAQLDNRAKLTAFELFRRELHNPEILTFDELFERARHIGAVEDR